MPGDDRCVTALRRWWGIQTGKEEEPLQGTEIEEGQTERDIDLICREKEPKPTEKEWGRLETCERPCSKEGWGLMTSNLKWKTMGEFRTLEKRRERSGRSTRSERKSK